MSHYYASLRPYLVPALWTIIIACIVGEFLFYRLALTIHRTHAKTLRRPKRDQHDKTVLAVVLGSGGHTAEMMRLLKGVDPSRYSHRIYLISSGDTLSELKALQLEKSFLPSAFPSSATSTPSPPFEIHRIPRARRVLQSYWTSPFTTIQCFAFCLWLVWIRPMWGGKRCRGGFADVVLMNGPGSCVPVAFAAFLPRILNLPSPSLIYIESLARTKRLSLSAKILRKLVDRFFVQWESLRQELVKKEKKGRKWKWDADVECEGWLV
ncbi:beta-1,4-N-acetylglucosaminyltransferase, glycosyltransferase family 1 protein [Pseudohyphozyma bogoriensis]|nr:beta-1,4-N-acetylglucosaminyltransferase, glycosyltransferase family 1 protein [Pseudohyphozyma bogoriensis]